MKHCFWRTAFVGLVFKHCLFAHSVRSKLASPQAALLSFFHFLGKLKTNSVAPSRGTWLRAHRWLKDRKEKWEKKPSGSGSRARDLSICSPMRNHLSYHQGPEAMTLKHCFWGTGERTMEKVWLFAAGDRHVYRKTDFYKNKCFYRFCYAKFYWPSVR